MFPISIQITADSITYPPENTPEIFSPLLSADERGLKKIVQAGKVTPFSLEQSF
jgi:hypothetical protein